MRESDRARLLRSCLRYEYSLRARLLAAVLEQHTARFAAAHVQDGSSDLASLTDD